MRPPLACPNSKQGDGPGPPVSTGGGPGRLAVTVRTARHRLFRRRRFGQQPRRRYCQEDGVSWRGGGLEGWRLVKSSARLSTGFPPKEGANFASFLPRGSRQGDRKIYTIGFGM